MGRRPRDASGGPDMKVPVARRPGRDAIGQANASVERQELVAGTSTLRETVLLVDVDGTATALHWPSADEDRRTAIAAVLPAPAMMLRCGKGILAFSGGREAEVQGTAAEPNRYATAAFADQQIPLEAPLRGPVLFARNPSKGSDIKPLTAAQAANLLVVTGARLV